MWGQKDKSLDPGWQILTGHGSIRALNCVRKRNVFIASRVRGGFSVTRSESPVISHRSSYSLEYNWGREGPEMKLTGMSAAS